MSIRNSYSTFQKGWSILIVSLGLLLAFPGAYAQFGKVNGVNLVGERSLPEADVFEQLDTLGCNMVALNPYAFGSKHVPLLEFDLTWQWEGETPNGARHQVKLAKEHGMGVIIKPHIWIAESGWAGELELANADEWKLWHKSYADYILHYAALAEELDVEVMCIGTELKSSIRYDPGFWSSLIAQVREVYSGKVTYAANWDNYQNVPFWAELDFMSVDVYFPCDTSKDVDLEVLTQCLKGEKKTLLDFAKSQGKKVLFTEYGYRSIDRACGPQWELPSVERDGTGNINQLNQVLAYRAFLKTFWPSRQVLGGCLWKWYPDVDRSGDNNDYTPQGKPALRVVRQWYEAFDGEIPLGE